MGCVKIKKPSKLKSGIVKNLKNLTLLTIVVCILSGTFCYSQEYTKWHLPEGAIQRFGKGIIRKVTFFPDGKKLAVSSSIGIWIYDVDTGEELDLLTDGWHDTNAIVMSPKGDILASAIGNKIQLWNTTEKRLKDTLIGHRSTIYSLAISPDGKTLVSGSADTTIRIWDTTTGKTDFAPIVNTDAVLALAYSPIENIFASVSDDDESTIQLWNLDTRENGLNISTRVGRIYSVSFSPDGTMIATGSWNGRIHLWDTSTGDLLKTLSGHRSRATSLDFSQDGNYLVSSGFDLTIHVWNLENYMLVNSFKDGSILNTDIAISPDGKLIACGSADDGIIRLWDAQTGNIAKTIAGHTNYIRSVAFSPDGESVTYPNRADNTILLRNVQTGEIQKTIEAGISNPYSVVYSSNSAILAVGYSNGQIALWNTNTGELMKRLIGHTRNVLSLAFTPDGSTLISGSMDYTIRTWDVQSGFVKKVIPANLSNTDPSNYQVRSVSISPDGNTFAYASEAQIIQLWDIPANEKKGELRGHTGAGASVAFSPNGTILASGSFDDTVIIWETETANLLNTYREPTSFNVYSVAFSPDGDTLAGGSNKVIRLWDTITGKNMLSLTGHTNWVRSVAFSTDGRTLASASSDGTVILWDVTKTQPKDNK